MSITKQEWEQQYIDRIPSQYKALFKKAYSGKSKASGIKARCLDCANFQRQEIELCSMATCPLFQYRPYKPDCEKINITTIVLDKKRTRKPMTDEHKAKLQEALRNNRNKA